MVSIDLILILKYTSIIESNALNNASHDKHIRKWNNSAIYNSGHHILKFCNILVKF